MGEPGGAKLNKRDRERLARATARWDTGGWTQYCESEPMVGSVRLGATEHAVLQSEPLNGGNSCTRHTLCGQHRFSVFSRATKRAFDDEMQYRAGKPCAICLRLVGPFRQWQRENGISHD